MHEQLESLGLCPKCAKLLSEKLQMSPQKLQNGGFKEIVWKVQLAEITMKQAGIEFDQKQLTAQAFEAVRLAVTDQKIQELNKTITGMQLEKEKSENQLRKATEAEFKEKYKDYDSLKQDLEKHKNLVEKMMEKIGEYEAKEKQIPVLKGNKLEEMLCDVLKRAFPTDEIVPKKSGAKEIDIIDRVIDEKKPIGKILVEAKNTKQWDNSWIDKTLEHMNRENTPFAVIASQTMPNEKIISPIGIEKEGILITPIETAVFAVAYMRLAMVKTTDAISKLESEKERIAKQAEIRNKILCLIDSKDFEAVFKTCKEIQNRTQEIRNNTTKISASSDDIDSLIKTIVNTNSKLNEAFENLSK